MSGHVEQAIQGVEEEAQKRSDIDYGPTKTLLAQALLAAKFAEAVSGEPPITEANLPEYIVKGLSLQEIPSDQNELRRLLAENFNKEVGAKIPGDIPLQLLILENRSNSGEKTRHVSDETFAQFKNLDPQIRRIYNVAVNALGGHMGTQTIGDLRSLTIENLREIRGIGANSALFLFNGFKSPAHLKANNNHYE